MAQRYPNMAKTLLSQQQMRYGQMRMKVSLNQQRATQLCMCPILWHFILSISFLNKIWTSSVHILVNNHIEDNPAGSLII